MKKTSFSFRAVRAGGYLHRFFFGKTNNVARHKNRSRAVMAAAVLATSLGISAVADAQCNTFQNADAANPLLSVFPAGKKIAGFAFADIDGDGDQDVYVDFLGKPEAGGDTLHLFKNIGNKTHPVFKEDKNTGFGKRAAGGQNGEMQFVDIDGDGDLDYFASDSTYTYYQNDGYIFYYENVGTFKEPHFMRANQNFLPIISANYIQPFTFADVDGDGDYDLYASEVNPYIISAYYQRVYYNTGTSQSAIFSNSNYFSNEDDGGIYRNYYDWNKDGLLDYFDANAYVPVNNYYRNLGPKAHPEYVDDRTSGPKFKGHSLYRIIDLNNDGAPEAFDFDAHYSVLTPVALIEDTLVQNGNKTLTILSSKNHNKSYTYRWELNGKTIPKANDYYLVARVPGTYTLYVTSECGTGVSLNYEVQKTAPLLSAADSKLAGFANDISLIGIKAYPNPFINSFTLQLPGKACTIKITDMAGRVLLSQTTSVATLQVGGILTAGSYIVQVWQNQEMIYNATIIKQ